MATREFNRVRIIQQLANGIDIKYILNGKLAEFDSRVFTIPFKEEVLNNIIWRQRDCVRNSISSVAQSLFSHTLLIGKNQSDMQEMCFEKGL
jgi:tRNA(His) 5'-end guanylyltransferase